MFKYLLKKAGLRIWGPWEATEDFREEKRHKRAELLGGEICMWIQDAQQGRDG